MTARGSTEIREWERGFGLCYEKLGTTVDSWDREKREHVVKPIDV